MIIKNVSNGTLIISDLPGAQSGGSLTLGPGAQATIFNVDAEESAQLASFITAGLISNIGSAEPTSGSSVANAISSGEPAMTFLAAVAPAASDNKFFWENGLQAVEASASWPLMRAGQVLGFSVSLNQATAVGSSMVLTLRKNGVNTGLSLTIAAAASGVLHAVGLPVAFAADDLMNIGVVANATLAGSSLMTTVSIA